MPNLDFPDSSSSPWTAPNGSVYVWNDDGYWEVEVVAPGANTLQEVTDAGNTTTNGINASGRINAGASDLDNRGIAAYTVSETAGTVSSFNYNPTGLVWQGFDASNNDINPTSEIESDGRLKIGGSINLNDPNISLNPDGSATFVGPVEVGAGNTSGSWHTSVNAGGLAVYTPDGSTTTPAFTISEGSNTTVSFTANGSGTFAGDVNYGDYIVSDGKTQTLASDAGIYLREAGTVDWDVKILNNGSATFAGTITGSRSSDANFGLYIENTNDQYNSSLIGFKLTEPDGTYNPNFVYCTDSSSSPQKFIVKSDGTTYINGTEAGAAISLASDGSAEFAGRVFTADVVAGSTDYTGPYSYVGPTEIALNLNQSTPVFKVKDDGSATFAGDVKIGGTLPAAPNITLDNDGSGTFAGTVQINDFAPGSTDDKSGIRLNASGSIQIGRSGVDTLVAGYNTASSGGSITPTFELKSDGNATFAGNIQTGGDSLAGLNDGIVLAKNGTSYFAAADGLATISCYTTGIGTTTSQIFADGSATFGGAVTGLQLLTDPIGGGVVSLRSGGGTLQVWRGGLASDNITSEISANGSATFAGDVFAGPAKAAVGTAVGSYLAATNGVLVTGDNSPVWRGYSTNAPALPTSQIDDDGSAKFAGQVASPNHRVTIASGSQVGSLASGEWYTNSSANDGDLVLGMVGDNNLYFFDATRNTDSIVFSATGSATFAGGITANGSINAENTGWNPTYRGVDGATDKYTSWVTGNGYLYLGTDLQAGANGGYPLVGDINVTLNGTDGSATFAGGVRAINGTAPSASAQSAFVQIAGSNTEGLQMHDGTDVNIQLSWDGSATFAKTVAVGTSTSPLSDLGWGYQVNANANENGYALYLNSVHTTSSAPYFLRCYVDGADTVDVRTDGSATFASYIVCQDNGIFAQSTDATHGVFIGKLGSTGVIADDWNAYITGDGGASFAGDAVKIYSTGDTEWGSGTDSVYINSVSGQLDIKSTDTHAIKINTDKVLISSNGTAEFAGTVSANGTILTRAGGVTLDVGDRLEKVDAALTGLKAALSGISDFAALKAALTTALADI